MENMENNEYYKELEERYNDCLKECRGCNPLSCEDCDVLSEMQNLDLEMADLDGRLTDEDREHIANYRGI